MNFFSNINQLLSFAGIGSAVRPLIQQALSGASLATMAREVLSSGVIDSLEKTAESLFPNIAPELKLAAGIVAAYDNDKTKWLQQALNAILGTTLAVDGIYGPNTTAAVEQFQQQQVGLKVDGWAYRVTTPLIEAALAKLLTKSPSAAKVITEQVAVTAPAQVTT